MVIQAVNMEILTSTHWDFTGKMGIEVTIRQPKTQWQRGTVPHLRLAF